MASPILHIKDSYYFEVPKGLWPIQFSGKQQFTGSYESWLRLDPQFQEWEAHRFHDEYVKLSPSPAAKEEAKEELIAKYVSWKADHAHAGKPYWRFIEEEADREWFSQRSESSQFRIEWREAIEKTSGHEALAVYRRDASPQWTWSSQKLAAYNQHLSGKILIPQPFGRLRNLYEKEWGFCVSRFMIIEVGVALVLWALFSWLARRVTTAERPQGGMWNLLEVFVVFIRDEIARPVIGHEPAVAHAPATDITEHAGHGAAMHLNVSSGVVPHDAVREKGHGPAHPTAHESTHVSDHVSGQVTSHVTSHESAVHAPHGSGHHHDRNFDADRFVPLLLTIFFFVLGCNLAGMLPWLGAPTGEWGTTSAVAIVTFATGVFFGMKRFGVVGYFLNQIPPMDLPFVMAVVMKPMIFLIEMLGLLIKHSILSIRLLANIVAGHIVLLSIIALAFSIEGAASDYWSLAFVISLAGSVLLSCLELFVAFLQAYIFTFLSAMFIGAAIHSH